MLYKWKFSSTTIGTKSDCRVFMPWINHVLVANITVSRSHRRSPNDKKNRRRDIRGHELTWSITFECRWSVRGIGPSCWPPNKSGHGIQASIRKNANIIQKSTKICFILAEIDMYQTQTRTSTDQYIRYGIRLCNVPLIYPSNISSHDIALCLYAYYPK